MSLCGKTEEDVFAAAAAGLKAPGVTTSPAEESAFDGVIYHGATKRRKKRLRKYKKPNMFVQYELFAPAEYQESPLERC